jgi:hypothetical protein
MQPLLVGPEDGVNLPPTTPKQGIVPAPPRMSLTAIPNPRKVRRRSAALIIAFGRSEFGVVT